MASIRYGQPLQTAVAFGPGRHPGLFDCPLSTGAGIEGETMTFLRRWSILVKEIPADRSCLGIPRRKSIRNAFNPWVRSSFAIYIHVINPNPPPTLHVSSLVPVSVRHGFSLVTNAISEGLIRQSAIRRLSAGARIPRIRTLVQLVLVQIEPPLPQPLQLLYEQTHQGDLPEYLVLIVGDVCSSMLFQY